MDNVNDKIDPQLNQNKIRQNPTEDISKISQSKNRLFSLRKIILLLMILFLVFALFQYIQYGQVQGISCGGDWSYDTKCPPGTYCKSLGQGSLAGGVCKPYLSTIFDPIFNNLPSNIDNVKTSPAPIIPTPTLIYYETVGNGTVDPDLIRSGWKTFKNEKYSFEFQYPDNIFPLEKGNIIFFKTEENANEYLNCITKKLGTIQKSCITGLFGIVETTDTPAYKSSEPFLKADKIISPIAQKYKDAQGREWIILGPVYGLGGTQTDAETKINGKYRQVSISIWDEFIKGESETDINKQRDFIKQILSTFKFLPGVSSSNDRTNVIY